MKQEITVSISDVRYQALVFALDEKGTTVEKEMDDALNRLFEKSVSPKVRDFTEKWEARMAGGNPQQPSKPE